MLVHVDVHRGTASQKLCAESAGWDCHPCKVFAESNTQLTAAAHPLSRQVALHCGVCIEAETLMRAPLG